MTVRADSEPRTPRVRRVDWQRPTKFAAEHVRQLRRAHAAFCQTTGTRLGTELRAPIELEPIDVSQLTWAAAQSGLPSDGVVAAFDVTGGSLPVLCAAELPLMLALIERHLGGPVEPVAAGTRRLTDVDLRIARHVLSTMATQLSAVWHDLLGEALTVGAIDVHPGLAHIAPASEPTLVLSAAAHFAGESHTLTLLLPWRAVDHVSDRLSAPDLVTADADAEATGRAMHEALAGVAVEVRAEAGSAELSLDRVLALAPGDVLALDHAPGGAVRLLAGDVCVGFARPGRAGTRRAVQLLGYGRSR
ncbi:MAG TPA: FliM/FliN family flagellar motor switch protein [Solirubrobacteraceae bacterium]|nr:FliM/FliN family flagellar motor switch protein [Solirubrobacteraceae bacterium]